MRQLRRTAGIVLLILSAVLGGLENGLLGLCGPFTDVTDAIFCPFVLEIFYLGITTGTTATTFAPADNVTRLQMAAFLSRTVDGVLRRGSRRAAVNKFWNARGVAALGLTTIASSPHRAATDGQDIWVTSGTSGMVSRVRAGDGKLLETITGVTAAQGVLSAMGRILVTGLTGNTLYRIDPTQTGGAVTAVTTNLGASPDGIAFDGLRIWTANGSGSVSIVTPGAAIPWTVTTVTSGFFNPTGALYDGANVWITDSSAGRLQKLDASGAILQSVTAVILPQRPLFDGANIWVPTLDATVVVVRASSGAVLQILTGNGLGNAHAAAFDGERVLVSSTLPESLSLWKAADLSPLGSLATPGLGPQEPCSDGINFWIPLITPGQLARF